MEVLNRIYSDYMSPSSCGIQKKLFWRWESKLCWTESFTSDSQQDPTTCLGLHGLSVFPAIWSKSPPDGDQLRALLLSSPTVSKHMAPDQINYKFVHRLSAQSILVLLWNALFSNMVLIMHKPWLAQKLSNNSPLGLQSGRLFLTNNPLQISQFTVVDQQNKEICGHDSF